MSSSSSSILVELYFVSIAYPYSEWKWWVGVIDADVLLHTKVFCPKSPIILENTLNVWVRRTTPVHGESEIITSVIDDTPVPVAIV